MRLEFQRSAALQTQVHLRLSKGTVHGSYCTIIEQVSLTWALLSSYYVWLPTNEEELSSDQWQSAICVVIHRRELNCIEGGGLRSASSEWTSGFNTRTGNDQKNSATALYTVQYKKKTIGSSYKGDIAGGFFLVFGAVLNSGTYKLVC
jgi:hypothetical protein